MKKTILAAAAAVFAAAVSIQAHAADQTPVKALLTCSADFFKAVAADKNIPEKYKIHDGDLAYLKVTKQPLDAVLFEKSFKEDGLTVAGYIFNDEIVRYFGMPDMHTHFWGLIVKEPWKEVVDSFKLDWEAVDINHRSAHANRMSRMNEEQEPGSQWKPFSRGSDYQYPEFGRIERAFHVAPYNGQTMIFCSMQSAGAPDEAILREVRPDLLYGEKKVPVREEATEGIDKNGNPVKKEAAPAEKDAKTLPAGHPDISGKTLPAGHPDIAGKTLPAGHPDISGGAKSAEPEKK